MGKTDTFMLLLTIRAAVSLLNIVINSTQVVDPRGRSNKMTYLSSWFIYSILLVTGQATPVSPEDASKFVCSGESIQLFENIVIDSINMVASLSISASQTRLIAMWTLQNATIAEGYSKKVFRDQYGDIWIRNVSSSDEAHYTLMYQIGIRFVTLGVHLNVLTAPTMNCKPKIKRVDDILSASLEASNCGKLIASAYWLKYPGIHYEGKDLVKLSPKNKAGTYYACIEGPALRCTRTSKFSDYCSDITIEDNHAISSESGTECSLSTYSLVMPAIILALIFLGVLLLFTHRQIANITFCWRPKKSTDVRNVDYNSIPLSDKTVDQNGIVSHGIQDSSSPIVHERK